MYKKIALVYDDSPESARALTSALPIAKLFNANLQVILLMAKHSGYTAYAQAVIPDAAELLAESRIAGYSDMQENVTKQAQEVGIQPEFHLFESGEDTEVITLLKANESDLLIVGLHHKGPLISRLWRSIYALAENAPCSVLGVH